jgi:hypothetical protein
MTNNLSTYLYNQWLNELKNLSSDAKDCLYYDYDFRLPINKIHNIDVNVEIEFKKTYFYEDDTYSITSSISLKIETGWIEYIINGSDDMVYHKSVMLTDQLFYGIVTIENISKSLDKVTEILKNIEYNKTLNVFNNKLSVSSYETWAKEKTILGALLDDWLSDFNCDYVSIEKKFDMCSVCREQTNSVLSPCMHCLCFECASKIAHNNRVYHVKCPICRDDENTSFIIAPLL